MSAPPAPAFQRLAFGHVAELYDRIRPPYPDSAIEAVAAYAHLAPGAAVVEVGAGTGKATVALARLGLRVLALEPSAEMARMLRENCARWPRVHVDQREFELWEPSARFAAVVCANAWHWLDHGERWRRAHRALAAGGALAALWTLPDWRRCALRDPLSEVYRRLAPRFAPEFPMHPDSSPDRLVGDWSAEAAASGLFDAAQVLELRWCQRYDADAYPLLLATHQDHILLEKATRERLFAGIAATIAASGGELSLPLRTLVCLAIRR